MRIGQLPSAGWGFDCNAFVSYDTARLFKDAGYSFAVRYVRRSTRHDYDLSASEIQGLLDAGLGVGIVQHVAAPGWTPTKALGTQYGETAASECDTLGVPFLVTVWCDLEGVSEHASPSETITFCNAWHDAVEAKGYQPGLYVGDSPGLTATELYKRLKFSLYWGAYNLNRDNVPIVRGLSMKQHAYPPFDRRVKGAPFEYDEDQVLTDALGDSPTFILP